MAGQWTDVAAHADLVRRGALVVRPGGRQIALFRTAEGILACNNRCPHEGYPLSEGSLDGACVLTCNWHNWKFDLRNGSNLYGGDRLRTYPVEVRGDRLFVDLADPPLATRCAETLHSLRDAFDDNDYARMARELGRLSLLGADPLDAVREAIAWSHDRMEFGFTHGFAGLADWLSLRDERAGDPQVELACLLEGIGHVADDVLREPAFPFVDDVREWDEDGFVAAVEAEDEPLAVSHLRGALKAGLGFDAIERAFARAALAHYNAFGHSAIYVTKARALIEALGGQVAEPLLLALTRQIVLARREDLIPEFRGYARAIADFGSGDPACIPRAPDWDGLGIDKALAQTVRSSSAPPEAVFHALLGANARNLLCFEASRQNRVAIPVSDNVSWLDVTHGITFAEAVGALCRRHPELWPAALLQLACFAGRNARHAREAVAEGDWQVVDESAFFEVSLDAMLDHDVDEFIVSVHRLKTLLAARTLCRTALPADTRVTLLAGLNRYLASPMRLKQVRRTVHQALQFVSKDL